ncbi:MAG: bifunctional diguanylate cyclase/phosphodiesterase [Gemmatimonadota bacterium]|nr:bifunctional diguanylate cyclase/phosphodiesterase [Gemmatimonadota bacterium]
MPKWSPRPIWEGLGVALLAMTTAVAGALVVSRENVERVPLEGMREGLEFLVVERDVSVAASDFIATLSMQMYEGGYEAELERRYRVLGDRVREAEARLDSMSPSDGWAQTHREMNEAVDFALDSFEDPRSSSETHSWLSEFLYDFKRVVPTDNMGEWSALLGVATWSQEVPVVVQDYLDLAMAREWQLTGREPANPDLIDSYNVSLAWTRQLRESHGEAAGEYTPFEEYIQPELAVQADSTMAALLDRLSTHPGVTELEAEVPYLLGLTAQTRSGSIKEVYALRDEWVPDLMILVEDLRVHALSRLDAELGVSVLRSRTAKYGGAAAVALGVLFAVRLIRRRLRDDRRLRSALEEDPLTGLSNRYALFSVAPACLANPELLSFALIQIDLDDFKSINDDYGHHVGDQALAAFAHALRGAVRSVTDLVCRVGGDEFVVLLRGLRDPENEAEMIVERLKLALETPLELGELELRLHFTAGIAIARETAELEELLVEADLALLDAKERGRDVARFFRRKLGRRMIHELSTALGTGELRCAFQPQIDLVTGSVVGLEALARWQREDRLQVPTRSLIDALEWLGASRDWLRAAMRDIELAWRTVGDRVDGRIWLNLMGCDIEDADPDELMDVFSSTDVPLDRIGVEITEAVGRAKIDEVVALLRTLREAGLAVALDDVGDDRVPLLHMTELPIDLVKLDRCVITGIDSQKELRAVVQSLSDMCDRLGLRVLGEGVETVEEEAVLRRLGLRYVQGFLYAKPLSISALQALLNERFAVASSDNVA